MYLNYFILITNILIVKLIAKNSHYKMSLVIQNLYFINNIILSPPIHQPTNNKQHKYYYSTVYNNRKVSQIIIEK